MSDLETGQRASGQAGCTVLPVGSLEGAFCYFLFWSTTQKQGEGVFHDCAFGEILLQSHDAIAGVKSSLGHDYDTTVLSAVKAHS